MSHGSTRRSFLKGAAGAAATPVIGSFNPRARASNENLRCVHRPRRTGRRARRVRHEG